MDTIKCMSGGDPGVEGPAISETVLGAKWEVRVGRSKWVWGAGMPLQEV